MRDFFKENVLRILILLFVSLVLVFCSRSFCKTFLDAASYENINTLNERVRCARRLGWEVDKTSETVKYVYIPNEMSDEFYRYNEMQKMCGFDLSRHMGKSAICYTYRILNFKSDNPVNAFLNIIIYENTMIGGDCNVLEYDDLYLPVKSGKTNADIT